MNRGRAILSSVLVALGALAYGISPIDIIPELLTGPLGLADDLAVWVGAGFAIYKLLTGKDAGPPVSPVRPTSPPPATAEPTSPPAEPTPPPAKPPRWEQKQPE